MTAGAAVLAVAAVAAVVAPGPTDPAAIVHVAPLRTNLTAATEIGRRGQGWTCFPAGAVRWRDLSFDPGEAAEAVARSLVAHDVRADAVATGEQPPQPGYVLSGTIRAVAVKACSAWGVGKMLGGGAKLKGRVTVGIDWTVRGGADGAVVKAFATDCEMDVAAKNAGYEVFLATGLARAGQDAAAVLTPAIAAAR